MAEGGRSRQPINVDQGESPGEDIRSETEVQATEIGQLTLRVSVTGINFEGASIGQKKQEINIGSFGYSVQNVANYHYVQGGQEQKRSRDENDDDEWIYLPGSIRMSKHKCLSEYSQVYYGERRSEVTGTQHLAIKLLAFNDKNALEAKTLTKLARHPNVVAIVHSDVCPQSTQMFIAMELCQTKTLHDLIEKNRSDNVPFNSDLAKSYIKQIFEGVKFIHDNDVIHGDLKPGNILISLDRKYLKISDFGISKELRVGHSATKQTRAGTDGFKAPETLKYEIISKPSDIYPLGVVTYIVLSNGKHPFGDNPHLLNYHIIENKNLDLSQLLVPDAAEAEHLLKWMLHPEPKQRPQANQLLNHPLFKKSGTLSCGDQQTSGSNTQQITKRGAGKVDRATDEESQEAEDPDTRRGDEKKTSQINTRRKNPKRKIVKLDRKTGEEIFANEAPSTSKQFKYDSDMIEEETMRRKSIRMRDQEMLTKEGTRSGGHQQTSGMNAGQSTKRGVGRVDRMTAKEILEVQEDSDEDENETNRKSIDRRNLKMKAEKGIHETSEGDVPSTSGIHRTEVPLTTDRDSKSGFQEAAIHVIDPAGGDIINDEFKIRFKRGTFLTPATIKVSIQINPSKLDPEHIAISPMVSIDVDQPLRRPATIQLNTWCVKDGSKEVVACIRRRATENEPWETISEKALSYLPYIEFKCKQFSDFGVMIRRMFFSYVKHYITGFVHSNKSNLYGGFCFQSPSYEKLMKKKLEGMGGCKLWEFNPIVLSAYDIITLKISTDDPGFKIKPETGRSVTFDENFSIETHSFIISGTEERQMEIELIILKNGRPDPKNQQLLYHTVEAVRSRIDERQTPHTIQRIYDQRTHTNTTIGTMVSGGKMKVRKEGCSDVIGAPSTPTEYSNREEDGTNRRKTIERRNLEMMAEIENCQTLMKESKFAKALIKLNDLVAKGQNERSTKLMIAECNLQLGKDEKAREVIDDIRQDMLTSPRPKISDVISQIQHCIKRSVHIQAMILIPFLSKLFVLDSLPFNAVDGIWECVSDMKDIIKALAELGGRLKVIASDFGIPSMFEMLKDFRSLSIDDLERKKEYEARCLNYIGFSYHAVRENIRAIEIYTEGLRILEHFGINASKYRVHGALLHNIGLANHNLGKYEEAENYYLRSIKAYEKATNWSNDDAKQKFIERARNNLKNTRNRMNK